MTPLSSFPVEIGNRCGFEINSDEDKETRNCRNAPETACLRKRAVRLNFIQMFGHLGTVRWLSCGSVPTSPLLMASRDVLADKLGAISGTHARTQFRHVNRVLGGIILFIARADAENRGLPYKYIIILLVRGTHSIRVYSFRDNYVIYRERIVSRTLLRLRLVAEVMSLACGNIIAIMKLDVLICGSNALFMMQRASDAVRRDRQINENTLEYRENSSGNRVASSAVYSA